MSTMHVRRSLLAVSICILSFSFGYAQTGFKPKYSNSSIYSGIEVGSKGVKMSIIEVGKNAQNNGAFNILKDTSVNTDFISFSPATFQATLAGLSGLYNAAVKDYNIPANRVYTVVSSGVKMQAEKDGKTTWIGNLVDSFRLKVREPQREVEVVDAMQEGRLSHLGIVPESRRFSTFLIDIGSGNTKGGFFPYDNTKDFKLFELNWGTKSTANATDKRCEDDKTLVNYNRQLYRVLAAAENQDIVYAVNVSGAYSMNDYIAFSGGIAWAVATLIQPEQVGNSVISVTYDDVLKFSETLYKDYNSLTEQVLTRNIRDAGDKTDASNEIKRVNKVFDQKAMMAGTGLLLRIMRQFKSVYETKEFYLVKNGQVGWVSAYVDQHLSK